MDSDQTELEQAIEAEGIVAKHGVMENGEIRFRLLAGDGSGYIRTMASSSGAWQNSHSHKQVFETYIVQRGWVALVELVDGIVVWHVLEENDLFTTRLEVPHNAYMAASSMLHTVKHGIGPLDDWHASAELDRLTKALSEKEIAAHRDQE